MALMGLVSILVSANETVRSSRLRLRRAASVARALSAVDVKDFARHESRTLEVEDRVHDIGDLTHAPHWVYAGQGSMRFRWMHRCFDDAGSNSIHANPALTEFDRQAL